MYKVATALDLKEEAVLVKSSSFFRKLVNNTKLQLLPESTTHTSGTPYSFVISKPYEHMSGDFFHTVLKGNRYVVCLGDAMGHGEEANGMAVEMRRILDIVLKNIGVESPGYMLKYCNFLFNLTNCGRRNYYNKTSDLAICEFNTEKRTLTYSSAKIGIVLVRDGKATRLKNDRCVIGCSTERKFSVKCHSVQLEKGDMIYLYSDGAPDQFGGAKNKRLGNKNLAKLLEELKGQQVSEIQMQLQQKLRLWQEGMEQTDDMTIIGISI
jgi:serine phosphatase RsbU (regulator of sigma subunit)